MSNNSFTCLSIAVGVDGLGHLLVCCRIVEEGADFVDNFGVVGADEMDCATLQCFGTFGGVTHDEHGLAQTWSFFLDATAVGEDDGGFFHQIDEFKILKGFNEEKVGAREVFAEDFMDGLADIGVEVHGIDEIHIGVFLREVFHGGDHVDETFTEVFSSMTRD